MKVVVFDLDGVNTAPVVKTLLAAKYPQAEIVVAKSSDKGDTRKTTSRFRKAAKTALSVDVEKISAVTLTAELVSSADVIVYENGNNLNLAARRLGKDFLVGKNVQNLALEPSGHHVEDTELETYLKTISTKVEELQLDAPASTTSAQPSATA